MKHPTLSKDPAFFSWKLKGAGLAYEFALMIFESKLVWIKGPLKPKANNDQAIFNSELRQKIPAGKKAVTDRGYHGAMVARPNPHDDPQLRTFKARARMRQEAFHSRIKAYNCMIDQFRHGMDQHKTCVESICVTLQYEMDLVTPMWEV